MSLNACSNIKVASHGLLLPYIVLYFIFNVKSKQDYRIAVAIVCISEKSSENTVKTLYVIKLLENIFRKSKLGQDLSKQIKKVKQALI